MLFVDISEFVNTFSSQNQEISKCLPWYVPVFVSVRIKRQTGRRGIMTCRMELDEGGISPAINRHGK